MTKRLTITMAAALSCGLIAAGCGGDDETTTTSTSTSTDAATGATGASGAADVTPERAQLIQEADAICAAGDKEIDAAGQELFGDSNQEPSAADQEDFVQDTVVPNIQDQIDQLRTLEPPAEDADEFTQILDDAQSALDEVENDPSSLNGGSDPFADVNQEAQDFGLKDCGS